MPEATPAEAPHNALTGPSGRLARRWERWANGERAGGWTRGSGGGMGGAVGRMTLWLALVQLH